MMKPPRTVEKKDRPLIVHHIRHHGMTQMKEHYERWKKQHAAIVARKDGDDA